MWGSSLGLPVLLLVLVAGGCGGAACSKSRQVLTNRWGLITHGPPGSNYTQDTHCEWLIKANSSEQFITLRFLSMGTECSFDYIYVYDGDSFNSTLLGTFSGKTSPGSITASSGFMLVLLYSDKNYVLQEGFKADYSITLCLYNCSGRGECLAGRCVCEEEWGGPACSVSLCPESCGDSSGRGTCVHSPQHHCVCKPGFSGRSCSLNKNDTTGSRWHWLYSGGLRPRVGHSAIYIKESDSLYVFGGYNLNQVLGDLVIFSFNASHWHDQQGNILPIWESGGNEELDSRMLKAIMEGVGSDGWGLPAHRSFLTNTLLTITDNKTFSFHPHDLKNPKKTSEGSATVENPENVTKPSPRYAHAATQYPGGLVVYGGRLGDGILSDELWLYDVMGGEWTLRAKHSVVRPPPLAGHTLTLADTGWLYVLGGALPDQTFSSTIYRIQLSIVGGDEEWEVVRSRGGKESDVRLVGHSTVFLGESGALIVYGGLWVTTGAINSRLSDRMFSFTIESRHWAELHYPRTHVRNSYIPSPRAFHSANIIGNYIVVFGGYTHRHNKDEICYDNQMFLYHLGCHTWVNQGILGNLGGGSWYPKRQGVFGHGSSVRNGNTLVVVGGYHGNVNSDLVAFLLPPTLASRNGDRYEPELMCSRHGSLTECTSDPECGWCSADDSCYGRTVGVNCTTNLQTTRCPGVCPALSTCHACLAHRLGAAAHPAASVATKLRLSQCTWCVQNAKCHHKHDNYGVCGLKEDTPSQAAGWWGDKGLEISEADSCSALNRRPGLTFIKYRQPFDLNHPDFVTIVNASRVDFKLGGYSKSENYMVRLKGFLRPAESWPSEHLRLCNSFSQATLKLSKSDSDKMEVVANMSSEPMQCEVGVWPGGENVTLPPGRYPLELRATTRSVGGLQAEIRLEHVNITRENPKDFTFEYLEPHEGSRPCNTLTNCLACLTDSKCGWCPAKETCFDRMVDEMQMCRDVQREWYLLVIEPEMCMNCSSYVSCEECASTQHCEWSIGDTRCRRRRQPTRGGNETAVSKKECPVPCYLRENCTTCLNGLGRCVWCHATQECFSFSVYTSEYQYGLCRQWTDQAHIRTTVEEVCAPCQAKPNCSTCLQSLGCGWCYDVDSPISGVCVPGDFTRPHSEGCSVEVNRALNISLVEEDVAWSYAQCPDVDECGLGLHDCHPRAKCTNTHGSFSCHCRRGYVGDGRLSCEQTCYEYCVHGECSGKPDFVCRCKAGWTASDCSVNCGCHHHSTCTKGVNICDQCMNGTTGEFCQLCKRGTFGKPTSPEGCATCNCNNHGDEEMGICSPETGVCFCKDNTEGTSCDKCKRGFYGDPRRGGMCYTECQPRGMVNLTDKQGLGSRLADLSDPRSSHFSSIDCFWIFSPAGPPNSTSGSLIELTIDSDISVPCTQNSVYVYDGVPQFVSAWGGFGPGGHQSQVLGVFCSQDTTYPVTVHAKSGDLTVHYKQGSKDEGFNATVSLLSCPAHCPSTRMCVEGRCVCPPGYVGTDCSQLLCPNNCSSTLKRGTCDRGYGRCLCHEGWGGEDCSQAVTPNELIFSELFNTEHLSESLDHLRKMLPRFGHSLVADRRGALWLFGGYSLSHGPLNDIRMFDTKNNTWMQVTVDSTNDANMPRGRYFHATEISQSRREIYIHGGLTANGVNSSLADFWKFNLKAHRWIDIKIEREIPGAVAGHTLTLRKWEEGESLVLIGGFNTLYGFTDATWEYDLSNNLWNRLTTSGSPPTGVYGHSTVYHSGTQSFYVYGGVVYSVNRTVVSNRLYALHYPTLTWSVLPPFSQYNPPRLNLPSGRLLHSAVTTEDYMLIFGGRTEPGSTLDTLIAYSYACNHWIKLLAKDVKVVGTRAPGTYAHAMALDPEPASSQVTVYIMGGFSGTTSSHVTKLTLPVDLCALFSSKEKQCKQFLGCLFCSLSSPQGNSTRCYSNSASRSQDQCQIQNGTKRTSSSVKCSGAWLEGRSCDQFTSCTECLARWPYSYSQSYNQTQVCKWCSNCGKCINSSTECVRDGKCGPRAKEVSSLSACSELQCPASDCDKCHRMANCTWTRKAMKTVEEGISVANGPVFDWDCVSEDINKRISTVSYKLLADRRCPPRCSNYQECTTCLASTGGEGGWSECRWSSQLSECLSPAYQDLYCAGGVCGRVLTKQDTCPRACSTHTQCSVCLSRAHCGWCSLPSHNTTGVGVCWEGSLEGPTEGSRGCRDLAASFAGLGPYSLTPWPQPAGPPVWNYLHCPAENECKNKHHSCDPDAEMCVDTATSYICICALGYKQAPSPLLPNAFVCVPVCPLGCVRGRCTAPGVCSCDFGYVGANCSIQCQCNGHSNCAGPDKLDICLDCQNNTQGAQCGRCKPLFVGDPTDNGQCVPCLDYCNGHSRLCVNDTQLDITLPIHQLEAMLIHGPLTRAKCVQCDNMTRGDKCEECKEGHFRGSDDHRDSCQPCLCNGHGDNCDPVTGERCNCGNNTESDSGCKTNCWESQCSRCRDSYIGTPTLGHQCYRQLAVDSRFCFDSKSIDECKLKPRPLSPNHSVFFAVQPRFMNVDIRITIDVTQGSIDLFMSPKEDTFVIEVNSSTGAHNVNLDSKRYHWKTERREKGRGGLLRMDAGSNASTGNWPLFLVEEKDAHTLTTYVRLQRKNTILMLRNLTDRLVITLPQDRHELGSNRFYIVLAAAGRPAYGTIFFRQDQLHIDLFVFFSVFFSCFFLFLAACVIAWKAKQVAEARRARRRHVVEMLHMAQRPFARVTVVLENSFFHSIPAPVAVEPTRAGHAAVATVLVRLPGGSEPLGRLGIASSLVVLSRSGSRPILRRRSGHS